MQTKTVRIVLVMADAILEKGVKSLVAPGNLHIEILQGESAESLLEKGDVVVFGAAAVIEAGTLRSKTKPGAKLIRCIPAQDEADVSEDDIEIFDDFWLVPLHEPRVRKRMSNIIREISEKFEADMNLRWLDTLINGMPDLVWFKDLEGVHHKVNDKFCEAVGKTRERIQGRKHCDIWDVPPDAENTCRESENAVIKAGHTMEFEEIVGIAGEKRFFKTCKTPLRDDDGNIIGTVGFGHDMTNLLNLGVELDLFMEAMPFPLIICGGNGTITRINDRFLEFFGERKDGLVGFLYDDWKKRMLKEEISPMNGEKFLRLHDGLRCVQLFEKELTDVFGDVVGTIGIFRDVTAEKDLELHVWRNANSDSLTGLANRHAFGEFVKKLRSELPLHLLYVDLDNFKSVNDAYGHRVGDSVLKMLADAMRTIFPHDFLVRLGGDEFLICVTRDVKQSVLERQASDLLKKVFDIFSKDERLSNLSSSIGIRLNGEKGIPVDTLIRQADAAMYEAKKRGKGRHCVWTEEIGEI